MSDIDKFIEEHKHSLLIAGMDDVVSVEDLRAFLKGKAIVDREPTKFTKEDMVQRYEDMSPLGNLVLIRQDDGDICVTVYDHEREQSSGVEFCMISAGGQSKHTLDALRKLMVAMERDNEERPQQQAMIEEGEKCSITNS